MTTGSLSRPDVIIVITDYLVCVSENKDSKGNEFIKAINNVKG